MKLDRIDEVAAKAFEGYVVRKDLAQELAGASKFDETGR